MEHRKTTNKFADGGKNMKSFRCIIRMIQEGYFFSLQPQVDFLSNF